MEHAQDGQWRAVWNRPLLNNVAPVHAIVSPAGRGVTFDNWHAMGYGNNVVVIYDHAGQPVRAMALADFLPEPWVNALPRSVSSVWWGDGHHFSADGTQLILRVVAPSLRTDAGEDHEAAHIELAFDLATGQAIPPEGEAWVQALAAAEAVNARIQAEQAALKAAFVAPLLAPHSDVEEDWYAYLTEAFFRLDPDWEDSWPATQVLRLPQSDDYQASVESLKNTLHDEPDRDSVLMMASPSQDNLVQVLSRLTRSLPRGWLEHVRVYVVVDDARTAAVTEALANTGATYVQINPDKAIVQRKARLDRRNEGE